MFVVVVRVRVKANPDPEMLIQSFITKFYCQLVIQTDNVLLSIGNTN